MTKKTRKKPTVRLSTVGAVAVGVLVVMLIAGAVYYRQTLRLARVEVAGTRFSTPEALVALARIDTAATLYRLDADVIADRVQRHPWVARAEATRLPSGTLEIDVEERVPVALVLGRDGRAAYYLDASGHAMPAPELAAFDVPILHGAALPRHATQPVASASVRELLAALAALTPEESVLASDLEVSSDGVTLLTPRAPQGAALTVKLGHTDYRQALRTLRTFWDEAVLTRPERRFETIDLRFSSQIVTRES